MNESSFDERFEAFLGELVLEGADSRKVAFDFDERLRRLNENLVVSGGFVGGTVRKRGSSRI